MNNPLRSLTLRGKLLLVSIVVEAVMLSLLVGNSVRLIDQHMSRLTDTRIEAIELAYKTALALPLAARDYATLRDIIDGWRKAEDVIYLRVMDNRGTVLAASGLDARSALPEPGKRNNGGSVQHVLFDVDYLGQIYGRVQYGISTEHIDAARKDLFAQGVLIAGIEILLTIVLLSLIGYWLTRHLSDLMAASGRVAQGDYSIRLRLSSNDEVAQLAEHFNQMAAAVQTRIDALSASEQRSRAIADYTYDWENWLAPDGSLLWVNPAVERVSGYTPDECHALPEFPLPLVFGDDLHMVAQCHAAGLAGKTGQNKEFRIRRKDNRIIWVAMSWQPIFDEHGLSLGYRSSIRDISLEHRAREELAYQATHDVLTGLYNRRAFERQLHEALAALRDGGEPRTLLYIDLDQFKLVNDTCGHSAGDHLLQQLTAVMQRRIHDGFLARLGGDEFGLLLETDIEEACRRADQLIDAINALPFRAGDTSYQIGASIGVVEVSDPEHQIDELLIAADQACYAAKDKGRNRIEVFHADDEYYRSQRAQFLSVADIHRALAEDLLRLHFQRIVPLRTGLVPHSEVLVRIDDGQGGLIPPGVFIPAAERFNLMPQIDHWVIERICQLLGDGGAEQHSATRFALNLSGTTLSSEHLIDHLGRCLRQYQVDPSRLCFEITETAAIGNIGIATQFIDRLHHLGATVALDDFGAGLSSFAYLRQLKADYLKIDALFIRNLHADIRDRAVVRSIMEVARVHDMQTIAEFVHTMEIADILTEMGIDYAQGYALHRPEPLIRTAASTNKAGSAGTPG